MRDHRRRGSTLLEGAMWVPFIFLLMMGMVEIARFTYTYYSLKKALYTVARYVGTQQAVNFCDPEDTTVANAKTLAIYGSFDNSGTPIINNLAPENITVRIERFTRETDSLGECECSAAAAGCDPSQGAAQSPDYLVISVENFGLQLNIPGLSVQTVQMQPRIRVPFGGT